MSIRLSYVARQDGDVTSVKTSIIEDKKDFRIGRDDDCHVILKDYHVSRCHAILRCDSDKHFLSVEDDSENGCLVNSRSVHRATVRVPILTSVLQISDYLFWFSSNSTIPNSRKRNQILEQHGRELARTEVTGDEALVSRKVLVRYLLQTLLPQESKLQAFCVDHFGHVAKEFGLGMQRTLKETLFIENEEPERIVEKLQSTVISLEQKYILSCIRARWQQGNE